jgi:hypothetical protein
MEILLNKIPGALFAHPSHKANDLRGTDWWVEHVGRHVSVDVKLRDKDHSIGSDPKDDVALEIWSVKEKEKVGWTRDASKRTDYVLWYWRQTGRWRWAAFAILCGTFQRHWQAWVLEYGSCKQFTPLETGGYHSECVFVPWAVLQHEMDRYCNGVVNAGDDAALKSIGF